MFTSQESSTPDSSMITGTNSSPIVDPSDHPRLQIHWKSITHPNTIEPSSSPLYTTDCHMTSPTKPSSYGNSFPIPISDSPQFSHIFHFPIPLIDSIIHHPPATPRSYWFIYPLFTASSSIWVLHWYHASVLSCRDLTRNTTCVLLICSTDLTTHNPAKVLWKQVRSQ